MRHQVERLKHVALKHGVKPARALTATLVAVGMMATMAVTSVTPSRNANAANANSEAGICTPTSVSLGTDTSGGTEDTGIATYAGGDMYVGQKVPGDMNNTSGPAGSYAAEAEGLTAVNGKLLMHPLKGLWTSYYTDGTKNGYIKDYKGFRFGIVGFGGQYRPKTGSSTLEVRGKSSDSIIGWVGGAQSWGNAGWIGQTKPTEPNYTANIAGKKTTVYGGSSNDILGKGSSNTDKDKYTDRASVYVPEHTQGTVKWQQNDDQIGSTGETFDGFGSYIKTLSGNLSNLSKQQSESVYVAAAKTTTNNENYNGLVRAKFDGTYSFNISSVHEKIIEFVGNGTSSMQVFNLPADMLNDSSSYSGVSFSFKNIPDTSSVVINVTGGKVDFHNGWRFWWTDTNNTTKELGGSYTDGDYAKRAQQIMWNFADASSVIIRGGQGSGTTTRKDPNSAAENTDGVWAGSFSLTTKDDPAAGMLGSILVPNGSFESHVSTNGRVWVGGNYAMYNPNAVGETDQDDNKFVNYERSHSASALDMDQERHNLPWNGSYSTSCAAIKWDKVDASTQAALGGTTWTVYASKSDAQNQSNALKTVTDNAYGDDDSNNGSFSIGGLNPNAIYYIREVSANNTAYATNTNIYAITAGGEGSTARVVTNVYDSEGNEITDSNKKLLPSAGDNSINAKIANKRSGTSIEWSKVDGTDTETLLGGSAWTLSKMNGNTTEQSWNIIDDQSGTEVKSVKIFDANSSEVTSASFTGSAAQQFHAVAYDQNGKVINNAKLTWESADPAVASVNAGLVTATGDGDTTITVKSADGSASATLSVHVKGVIAQTSVNIKDHNNGDTVSLEKGKTLQLTATVAPEDNTVKWSSSDTNAVSLNTTTGTGTSVTLTANSVTATPVTITAKETRGNKTFTLSVTVTAKQYLTLYFEAVNNWPTNNVMVGYGTSSGGWSTRVMQQVPGCADSYAYVDIPLADITADSTFLFQHTNNDGQYYYPPANYGGPKAWDNTGRHNNFKFVDNGTLPEAVTISAGPNYSITAPSGCAVTQSASNAKAAKSTKRAVATSLRTNARVTSAAANTATATKADEDTAAGRFKVSDLADGTYHLQETVAPNGYEVSDTVYTITIANGVATWNPASDGYKLPNTRKTGTVKWNKVSSEYNGEMLSGSEWKLTKTKSFSWDNGTAKYTTVTDPTPQTIKDCVNGESGVSDCSTQSGQYVDLNGDKGKFELHGLAWGEYQLVETKAPDGFNLDSTPHMFRIGPAEGSDVTGKWYTSSSFKTDSTGVYNANTAFTVDGGSITNTPGVVLPGTGGEGLNKMYAAGFLAVAIAVAGLALSLRRRQ